jgi:hypothetical protein
VDEMAKVRLIRTTVIEIEVNPEWYPEGATLEEMAEIEANVDDRELQFADNVILDDVKWEIIKD